MYETVYTVYETSWKAVHESENLPRIGGIPTNYSVVGPTQDQLSYQRVSVVKVQSGNGPPGD